MKDTQYEEHLRAPWMALVCGGLCGFDVQDSQRPVGAMVPSVWACSRSLLSFKRRGIRAQEEGVQKESCTYTSRGVYWRGDMAAVGLSHGGGTTKSSLSPPPGVTATAQVALDPGNFVLMAGNRGAGYRFGSAIG
ncbi:unnamed protein product [Merluccius merluccius]